MVLVKVFLVFIPLWFSAEYASSRKILNTETNVALNPPKNVTVVYVGENDVFLYWFPPSNYEVHKPMDLSPTLIHRIHQTIKDGFGDSGKLITHLLNGHLPPNNDVKITQNADSSISTTVAPPTNVSSSMSNDTLDNSTSTTDMPDSHSSHDGYKILHVNTSQHSTDQSINKTLPHFYWYGKLSVPMTVARIVSYSVSWNINGSVEKNVEVVSKNRTDFHIRNLQPDTDYEVSVSVKYLSQTVLSSDILSFRTKSSATDKAECLCNKIGTVDTEQECKISHLYDLTRICTCKEGYSGLFCHVCEFGYYRMGPNMPCYKCPCSASSSNTACHFEEGYLFCDACLRGYTGNLCHQCHQGYYMNTTSNGCKPCQCHQNSYECVQHTGECFNCRHNTAGFSCERCRHGYVGDAVSAKNCTHTSKLQPLALSTGWIVTICVLILLIISGIVAFFLYRRYKYYPTSRPFWTVELKDDHEGVNFSSVPEDELHGRDDSAFYEKQGGKRGRGGAQQYSHLTEST